jgi:alpha-galactosidase
MSVSMAATLALLGLPLVATAVNVKSSTPLMGWNSYNYYSCNPSEAIMKSNAQGLVTLGLDKIGYTYVTTDCGWNANYRDSSGKLVWNPATFPSGGGAALGQYIQGLGLKFGVYSGGGYYQCGSTAEPASLGSWNKHKVQVLFSGFC